MIICTSCQQGRLQPTPLVPGLTAYACDACGGMAMEMAGYLNWRREWLSQSEPAANPTPAVPTQGPLWPAQPGRRALKCPTCQRVMSKHFAHAGPSPEVNSCLRCEVIWLEPRVWPYLMAVGLHTSLTTVTTTAWQNRRSQINALLQLNAEDRALLGEAVYRQALQIDAWLQAQPHRRQILRLLQRLEQYRNPLS